MNIEDFMTVAEAATAIGAPNKRAVYRAIARAAAAGHATTAEVYGKQVVARAALATLQQFYYPYYSDQHQANVKKWGAAGGAAKAANRRKASR
jgi:hypothetical protein